MSKLRSAIDVLQAEDLAQLADAALEERFAELQRASEALEAERLRCLAEVDRRRAYLRDGYLSTSSWFAGRFKVAHSAAGGDLRMARALQSMPETREALVAGEVSLSAARVLVAARETDQEAFSDSEALLVEAARRHSIGDLGKAASHWRNTALSKRMLAGDEDPLVKRRRLHLSPTVFGMVRIDGDLDPDTGETVLTAVRSFVDGEVRSGSPANGRTPAQRRADALGEICRAWLDATDRPSVGGERPHVTVIVDLEALAGNPDGRAELEHLGPISPEDARRWACDASISRVITKGASEPLDVGRRTPVVSPAIRRALVVRDGGCSFPRCGRPPAWTEAHHVTHWADGGTTSVADMTLLCRPHHRLVHHGFTVKMIDGRPVFRRPDGSILEPSSERRRHAPEQQRRTA